MADTGWVIAGAGANNADAGNVAWATPENVTNYSLGSSNSATASSVPKSTGTTQYLHVTGFGFGSLVPAGSTIDGVEMNFSRYSTSVSDVHYVTSHTIQLLKAGTRSGSNLADSTTWGASGSEQTYGGSSNLWGNSLLQADVAASNFGVAIRAQNPYVAVNLTCRVEFVEMRIHYTPPAAGNTGAMFMLWRMKDRLREILKPKRKFWLPEPSFA